MLDFPLLKCFPKSSAVPCFFKIAILLSGFLILFEQSNASNKSSESISTDTTEFRVLIKKLENLYYDSGAYQEVINLSKEWQKNHKYQEDKKDEAYYWYRLFHLTGNGYISSSYYDSAIHNFKKSLKISLKYWGEDSIDAMISNLGLTFYYKNRFDSAEKYYEKSIQLCLKNKDYTGLINTYNNLALIQIDQGKNHRASLYLDYCFFYARKYKANYKETLYYNNKSLIEENLGNKHKSLEYDHKSLQACAKEFSTNHPQFITCYGNLATGYLDLKKYDSAFFYNEKSNNIRMLNYGISDFELAQNYTNKALIHKGIGRIDSAYKYLSKTYNFSTTYPKDAKEFNWVSNSCNELGVLFLDSFQYDSAVKYFNLSLNSLVTNSNNNIDFQDQFIYALDGISETYYKLYKENQNADTLIAGINHYYTFINYVKSKAYSFWSEDDYSFFNDIDKSFYGEALDLLYDLIYEFDEPDQLDSALYVMEAYRGLLLRRSRDFSTSGHLKGELEVELEQLKTKMERIDSEKLSESDSLEFMRLQEERLEVARKLDLLYEEVQEQYPGIYEKKSDLVSISGIQESLSFDEAVIEYLYADETVYALVIDQKSVSFKKVAFKIPNDSVIEPFAAYRSLVEPLELGSHIRKLIIIPDGPLWDINFELLVSEKTESDDPKEIPYLFKKYAISYAYAASLLFQDKNIERKKPVKPLLAFSFGESDNTWGDQISLRSMRSSSQELPGSRAEIRAIADLVDGDYFYGQLASEKKFREVASDYKILHLAVHGETDEDKPENSRLYFFSEGDSIEDGKLHAFELYNMQLDADLAVLTACNTGSGEIAEGEGVMSLGRAFAYAGVNSLLLTRHEISDAVAPELMKVFYRELKNGKRKSEALRLAKLEFLENANNINADPFYWGSFYILGNDDPIAFEDDLEYWKYVLVASLVLLAVILILRWKFGKT